MAEIRPGSPGAVPPSRKDGRYRPNGLGETTVTAVDWLDDIHRLFPRETVHRLERDAVEKYEITEVVTDLEALQRIEPSVTLLRAVLRTKHLMDPRVLAMAKKAVDNVVRELIERLSVDVRRTFHGKRSRHRTAFRNSRNFRLRGQRFAPICSIGHRKHARLLSKSLCSLRELVGTRTRGR